MYWWTESERINVKDCYVSNCFWMDDVAQRARELLKTRSSVEIEEAASIVDDFINEFFEESKRHDIRRGIADDDVIFCRGVITDACALRAVIDAYDLGSDEDFPNGQPFEYFAALALFHAIEGTLALRPAKKTVGPHGESLGLSPLPEPSERLKAFMNDPSHRQYVAARAAVQAMEAIAWAETC